MVSTRERSAFTLIELLLVIGVIGILAAVVIVALNPTKQLADAKDAQRRSDIKAILDAVYQFNIDFWMLPQTSANADAINQTATEICSDIDSELNCAIGGFSSIGRSYVTLTNLLNNTRNNRYITEVPVDPDHDVDGDPYGTSYEISIDANGRITVTSTLGNEGAGINLTR